MACEKDELLTVACEDGSYNKLSVRQTIVFSKRSTIFSPEGIEDINQTFGDAAKVLDRPFGLVLQFCLFCFCTFLSGIQPVVQSFCMVDPSDPTKKLELNLSAMYVASFLLSIVVSNIVSYWFYGAKGLGDCWNPKQILVLFPIGISFAFGEIFELYALKFISSSLNKTLQQLKLPVAALMGTFMLRQNFSLIVWCQILATTAAILGYSVGSMQEVGKIEHWGVYYSLATVAIGTVGTLYAELNLKTSPFRFGAQFAQLRVSAFIGCFLFYFIRPYIDSTNVGIGLFENFNRYVWLAVGVVAAKDLVCTYLIKRLDNIWRSLSSGVAIGVTFCLDNIIMSKAWDPSCIMFIVMILINVCAYGLAKQMSSKYDEVCRELAEKTGEIEP